VKKYIIDYFYHKVHAKLKGKLYCTTLCRVILYGSAFWTLKKQHGKKSGSSRNENAKI